MGLGVIYYFISFQQTIGTNSSFSEGASEEDESIATLDEAVMEVHAKQTRGNGWVGIEICVFSSSFFPFSSMASDTSFSSTNDPITIQNFQDPQHPLLTINLSNITKLSSTNYLTWSLQIQYLLEGYDLHHFIDDTHTPPPPTITITGVASPNPAYTICKRQDHLIFSALLGDISISLQPLIAHTTTFLDAWQTLANTYDKPSRGHIKQLKEQLKRCTKGSKSINEYMQAIKTCANELALLGKPVDDEDLIDRVLKGLSDE
ncbi:Retrovirus-related Pol polyprotein from transposon RE1 [Vitis vinifera]|uniref:Retrovirus-related Pol polyprotein from transposon RE1 n=1 Tax=Vitis vinifera TaxID=29760 RepID=A0A438CM05_VITVI|nr:Retrovirus-related Pol polyprotein from transposon RE1 [Vitis vinifera]